MKTTSARLNFCEFLFQIVETDLFFSYFKMVQKIKSYNPGSFAALYHNTVPLMVSC